LAAAREHLLLPMVDLWLAYVGVGGDGSPADVGAWLSGRRDVPDRDYDFLAQALNEAFIARGMDHPVAYADEAPSTP
jgi:hypothetical protein